MRVEELHDSFCCLHHYVGGHVDDIVVVLDVVLDDHVDGVRELLVVPDDLRDILVDVMHVLELLVVLGLLEVRDDDVPLSSFF